MHPLLILAGGMAFVLGAILLLRVNAFVALIGAAVLVSLLAPGPLEQKLTRVAEAFGATAGSIAIVIAMAAIIGQCMMESGAADRVVRAFLGLLGENRGDAALAGSGFLLSIPVFFDTVFYLLIPLARSMYLRTGRHYLRYVMAIAAGGTITHTLVPPTPGPMIIADTLKVDLGLMMVIGLVIGAPSALVGLAYARWMDRRYPLIMRPVPGPDGDAVTLPAVEPPGLLPALLPIMLPVVLIATHTIVSRLAAGAPGDAPIGLARQWTAVLGNPNLALMAGAAVAVALYVRQRRASRAQTARLVEAALMSAGLIILITAGGGAFGAMLRAAEIGPSLQALFAGDGVTSGVTILLLAFGIASVLKFAQGSSTVAMITTAGIMAAMIEPASLGFNVVYLAVAIGTGSLVGSWMNDSGFWIYCRMGGMTEPEALRSWTVLLALLGVTAMSVNLLLAILFPMPAHADSRSSAGAGFGRPDSQLQNALRIDRLDPALDRLVAPDATIEILADGYDWSEGPVWVKEGGFVLFSDVPRNVVHVWKEGEGARPYLTPSGYTGSEPRGGEMGSNGLVLDRDGRLVLCQHGDRRVARMDAPVSDPRPAFTTLADRFEGRRFNSPNDLVFHSNGGLYFTDPAYGMEKQWDDPRREMPYAGVYRRSASGAITLLTRDLTRPNGLAFSPDERRLYVAQSDPGAALWRVFDMQPDGTLGDSRVFFDATAMTTSRPGLPDGLKIDTEGNLFATGPGGVLVFSPDGTHLGTILTGQATGNCAFGDDGRTLYITADSYLMRVRLRTKGMGF